MNDLRDPVIHPDQEAGLDRLPRVFQLLQHVAIDLQMGAAPSRRISA
jgi:hypothetical protein